MTHIRNIMLISCLAHELAHVQMCRLYGCASFSLHSSAGHSSRKCYAAPQTCTAGNPIVISSHCQLIFWWQADILIAPAAGQMDLSDKQALLAMDSCAQMMAARYDDTLGGFGSAPKFPRPAEMNLLLVQPLRLKAAGSKAEARQYSNK